ncbi:TPA: hypothetical protein ACK3JR_001697 [Mannheimia haemolytica]
MNLKEAIKSPEQPYIKNSSMLITVLFIIAGVLYYPTNGYGSVIALALAVFVLMGQKYLIAQTRQYFAEMYAAKKQFELNQDKAYLEFIIARGSQMLNDNKVLSDKAKVEIEHLLTFAREQLK